MSISPFRLATAYLEKAFLEAPEVKAIGVFLGSILGYVAGRPAEQSFLAGLAALVALDVLTGTAASIREGNKFRSKRVLDTAWKALGYACVIIAVSILDHTVASSAAMPLTSGIMSIFIIAEVASLLENVRRLGVKTPKIRALLDAYVAGNEQTPLGPVKKGRKDQDG